jgi:ribose-phosphate pyrophosphokinase
MTKVLLGSSSSHHASSFSHHELIKVSIQKFPDCEISLRLEDDLKGQNITYIHTFAPPVNGSIVELLSVLHALEKIKILNLTLIIPYMAFNRSINEGAHFLARALGNYKINNIKTLALHNPELLSLYSIPIQNINIRETFLHDIQMRFSNDIVVVAPDKGAIKLCQEISKSLTVPLITIDKKRNAPGDVEIIHINGDVHGKVCVIIDDMIDSGATLKAACQRLRIAGASQVHAYAVHNLFSKTLEILSQSFDSLTVTNSIAQDTKNPKVCVLNILGVLTY